MDVFTAISQQKSVYSSESSLQEFVSLNVVSSVKSDASHIADTRFLSVQHADGSQLWYIFASVNSDTDQLIEIDPEQRWFWTGEWQAKEREADEDLKHGRYESFDNFEDFIDSL